MDKLIQWQEEITNFSPQEIINWTVKIFDKKKLTLASSLGLEDQVLTHMFLEASSQARIFTLDTGRIFQQTYDLMDKSQKKYNFSYEALFPQRDKVENLIATKGVNSFYDSIENRKECCEIRKMEPLRRVLKTVDCWITGLRSTQSITRSESQVLSWDKAFQIYKINPLNDWSEDDCWQYIKKHNIPYNELHDKGFPSIGCQPCTRAIKQGDDIRSGRWWWEMPEQKECGLHMIDGKLARKNQS